MNRKFFLVVVMTAVFAAVFAQIEVSSTATTEDKKVVVLYATPNEPETTLTVDGVLYKLRISPIATTKGGLQFNWEWLSAASSTSTEGKKVVISCVTPNETHAMVSFDGKRYKIKISPTTTAEGKTQFKWEWSPLG
jgi:hypothetical protein